MTKAIELHPDFNALSPTNPVMPFRLTDVSTYIENEHKRAVHVSKTATAGDELEFGLHTYAVQDIADCTKATEKLKLFQAAGEEILYLDVTKDVAKQIAALPAPKIT